MTLPLIVLGAASVFGGLLLNNWIGGWLEPAVGRRARGAAPACCTSPRSASRPWWWWPPGSAIGVWLFGPRRDIPRTQPASASPFVLAGRNDLYGDAFNEAVFMRPGQRLTDGLVRLEDSGIDGTVNGTAAAIGGLSARLRRAAERVRPLLRPDHDGGSCGGRCGAGARTAGLRGERHR